MQTYTDLVIVHAQQWQEKVPLHSLEIDIIVNQATQQTPMWKIMCIPVIHCGMARTVKVPAALVPTLPHGSEYSCLLQQQA